MQNKTLYSKALLVIMATVIFLGSCSSTTLIQSVPSGASVYIDGETSGKTPHLHTDKKILFSETTVVLEKEGYETFATTITRNEEPDIGAIIGGFIIWPIWLWALKYKVSRTYELRPAE
jgi:hypothetical protein